jgi:5-methylcytosine-specific restriction endonuclease McrA
MQSAQLGVYWSGPAACGNTLRGPDHADAGGIVMAARKGTQDEVARQWAAELRRLYEQGTPMGDLVSRFGIPEGTIYDRAGREGWDRAARKAAVGLWSPGMTEDGRRICRVCGEAKPLSAYRPNGAPRPPRATCRQCERDTVVAVKQRARVREAERDGREYRSRVEWDQAVQARQEAERQARAERRRRRKLLTMLRALLVKLHFRQQVAAGMPHPDTERYRRRWAASAAFREHERRRQQRYKHANPEAVARDGDRRKQRAAATADGSLTRAVVARLFADADLCPYCAVQMGERDKALDHKEPLACGGTHTLANVVVCCRRCNHEKRDRPWAEWCDVVASRAGIQPETRKSLRHNNFGVPLGSGPTAGADGWGERLSVTDCP